MSDSPSTKFCFPKYILRFFVFFFVVFFSGLLAFFYLSNNSLKSKAASSLACIYRNIDECKNTCGSYENCVRCQNNGSTQIRFRCLSSPSPTPTISLLPTPTPQFSCNWNERTITDTTEPYVWYNWKLDQIVYKCIAEKKTTDYGITRTNTGYRCKTDKEGRIIANGSIYDANHCPIKQPLCMYEGYTVTEFSAPYAYYFKRSDSNGVLYLCIVEKVEEQNGLRLKNTGVRCKTDADGNIIANGSITDFAHCSSQVSPTPTPTAPKTTVTEVPLD